MRYNDEPYGTKQCMGPVAAAAPAILGTAAAGAGTLGTLGTILGTVGKVAGVISAVQGLTHKDKRPSAPQVAAPAPEKPITRPDALSRPEGLSTLAGYAPDQERTALATKGINTGLGSDEDAYYKNLVQRSLIGDGNSVASGSVDDYLKPVESQYFSRQGANTGNITDFIKSIRGY